jgi:exodeoxyribonuclease V alpha subunit
MIKGIGPVLAARLVKAFGKRVFDFIETAPHSLTSVEGIGKTRQYRIEAAWKEQKAVREIMVFLHSHSVSTSRAFRIFKQYGNDSIKLVQEDPYRLARDIWGIGFKTADQIAASIGISKQSELRARAGVEYVLNEMTSDGHCAYPRDKLAAAAVKMLEIPDPVVQTAIDHGLTEGRLIEDASGAEKLIYLAPLYHAEVQLAKNLLALSCGTHPCPQIDTDKAVAWVEGKIGLSLAPEQRAAVKLATKAKVMIVTGGPGVGKTTIINAILKVFHAKKLKVVLCAPTGRAAKRMSETTGMTAKTIHRLLEFDPKTGQFKHDATNPLGGDVFVVDETSMVDLVLAHQLVRAIPPDAALILVGDVDQLPSVGPGCVLRDIIESGAVPVCRLTEIFRQAAKSAIVMNAHRVNKGLFPVFRETAGGELTDFYFCEAEEPEKGQGIILKLVQERIPKRFRLRIDDIQVITPMQRGELGARSLNALLQNALNPTGPSVQRYGWTFRVGDKVMQTVNDYEKDVFNGDIGRIASLDEVDQEMTVDFEGRQVVYDYQELDELVLSYAITIHKSQGSEYPAVVIPLHTQAYMLLQRNLLYTALTRGRKLVVIVGSKKAVAMAVKRVESRGRVTRLRERMMGTAALTT